MKGRKSASFKNRGIMAITIFCDMDGVLSDFDEAYTVFLNGRKENRETFREATEDSRLFRELKPMNNWERLVDRLNSLNDTANINVEILSSVNKVSNNQRAIAVEDKTYWLKQMGIEWDRNFVNCKEEKARYATPNSILIDDNLLTVADFKSNYGYSIFHIDTFMDETLNQMYQHIGYILGSNE